MFHLLKQGEGQGVNAPQGRSLERKVGGPLASVKGLISVSGSMKAAMFVPTRSKFSFALMFSHSLHPPASSLGGRQPTPALMDYLLTQSQNKICLLH